MIWQIKLATTTVALLTCGQMSIELLTIPAANGQTVADDVGEVCWDNKGNPIECRKDIKGFTPPKDNPFPRRGNGGGSSRVVGDELDRGSGRFAIKGCRHYGDRSADPRQPKCPITSLPEAQNEDPILIEPSTPDRTQGSGTR